MKADQAARLPQYVAAVIATLGAMEMGSVMGWMSPAAAKLEEDGYSGFAVSQTESSLLGGIMPVGAMAGSAVAGYIADSVGRRTVLIGQALPWFVSWPLMIWANEIWMMYVGRFLQGCVIGLTSVVAPMYVNEISQTHIQGTLGSLFVLECSFGIVFSYILGKYVSVFWLSVGCSLIGLVYTPLILMMPESPRFHLMKNRQTKAQKSLQWLRGTTYEITSEIKQIQNSVDIAAKEKVSMRKAFATTAAKKGLVIGVGLMALQQFCGVDAIIFYTVTIFQDAGSTISPNDCTIYIGVSASLMTFLSVLIVDRLGRKPLLISSCIAQTFSCIALGVYYLMKSLGKDLTSVGWLPLPSVAIFTTFFAVGLGPIPWLMMVEVFPGSIRGPATSLATLCNWFGAVLVSSSFSPLKEAIGAYTLFWIYGAVSALGVLFVAFTVPETKGKNIEEVTEMLSRSKT